jgi:hypothetical protein
VTARGVDFLEKWIAANVNIKSGDRADAGLLAAKLVADAAVAGFTLADMELDEESAEEYIREAMVHPDESGALGD